MRTSKQMEYVEERQKYLRESKMLCEIQFEKKFGVFLREKYLGSIDMCSQVLTFATNHFSTYVVAVESISSTSLKTADNMNTGLYVIMLLWAMGMLVTGVYVKRRYR